MIDVDEAHRILFEHVTPGPVVELPLRDALYRTLAQEVLCDIDAPPFDRSLMDGFAVKAADVRGAPVHLRVVGRIAAGTQSERTLGRGETMQINTGAPIPRGADAVVRVEETESGHDGTVLIKTSVPAGKFITRRAEYLSAGTVVLEAGTRLRPTGLGAAATCGVASISVYRQPRVAILSTGDELIEIDRTPTGPQIRNSNQFLLEALVQSAHAAPVGLSPVGDDLERLTAAVQQGLEADVLCISGGISMGDRDYVPQVLQAVGATFRIHKMAIKPGRPTIFATTPTGKPIFALPGNPASAFVGFELLVRPALCALEGRSGVTGTQMAAELVGSLPANRDRRSFVPARAWTGARGQWCVERVSWGGSGDSLGLARANAMIVFPPHAREAREGAEVTIMLLDPA